MRTYLDYTIEKVSLGDKNYPNLLAEIKKPPKQIYHRGSYEKEIFKRTIAIVGTRMITSYGKQAVDQFVSAFVADGVTIISGFMYGVDTEVHKKTIEYGGRTISVFGNGLDVVYPPENDKLYLNILENDGLILSEYEKDIKPQLWTYPARNRIVAGLSTIGVLVIEADEESGSMITANLALKQGKKVWAIPGPITSKVSRGTNLLIKNGLAQMATSPSEILGKSIKIEQLSLPDFSSSEAEIYAKLENENLSIDELAQTLSKNVIEVTQTVTMMSLRGVLGEAGGKFFISKL